MKRQKKYYLRKAHRWISVFVGVQILMWTASGVYFSWTNIDEIHGDQFLVSTSRSAKLSDLAMPELEMNVSELALRFIDDRPYLWVNGSTLIDAQSGEIRSGVTQGEAERIARRHVRGEYVVSGSTLLTEVGRHHEYRGRPLPAWAVTFDGPTKLTAYVAQRDGSFQRVRHTSWRVFDFLWMLHTMDYRTRDDFNNLLLRLFALLALVVVASGFTLFWVSRLKRSRAG